VALGAFHQGVDDGCALITSDLKPTRARTARRWMSRAASP
jgi:predicted O-methyltransferase YrrM